MVTERNPVDFDAWFDRWIDILGELEDAAVRRHQEGHDEIPAYLDEARDAAFDHLDELRPLATGQQPSPPATDQQPCHPTEQWEYTLESIPRGTVKAMRDYLNWYGDNGWELCLANFGHLVFKRRKS